MKLNLKTIILGVSALAVVGFGRGDVWAQRDAGPKSYKVLTQNDGYELQLTAKLKDFPSPLTLEITLDDPARGKTTVRGTAAKLSDTSFRIKTSQKFKFRPSSETRVLMRRFTGRTRITKPGLGGPGTCGGCPGVQPPMDCMDPPACTMCMCWAEFGAKLNGPSTTELAWTCGEQRPISSQSPETK